MRRILAMICCTLAVQTACAGKLKGATRRSLQLTRPPRDDTDEPKETPAPKTPGPPPPPPKMVAPKPRGYEQYTWSSGDQAMPKSVHAVVSKSKHDVAMEKMKPSKMAKSDDYDEYKPKSKDHTNRPPRPAGTSPDAKGGYTHRPAHPVGTSPDAKDGYTHRPSRPVGTSPDAKGWHKAESEYAAQDGSYDYKKSATSKYKSGGYKSGGYKSGGNKGGGYKSGGYKSGRGNKGAGKYSSNGASYDGSSYDMPIYNPSRDNKGAGSKYSKESSSKDPYKDGSKKADPTSPRPPQPGYGNTEGAALTGVPVSRFALLYEIDHDLGMPMTSDYEDVHESTYLWLYTVMYRTFGDRMKNLLTDDTSNLYERDEPILIEYASVILFESDDEDIPTTAELDELVTDAFSGGNAEAYLGQLQDLSRSNPFSSTSSVTLQTVPTNQGRSVVGTIASRVSTKGATPFIAAAAFCVVLAGGALVARSRNSGIDGKDSKAFDTFSRGEATAMTDDFTQSLGSVSEKHSRTRRVWDLELEEHQPNLSPISEHQGDPDLSGWNEYFDSSNGSKESDKSTGEQSQYSIEDFVNEAERNLLGVRIRYPGEKMAAGNQADTSTALVPVFSNSMVPAPSSSLIPAPPSSSMVPASSSSLGPATPDEIDEASTQIDF